MPRVRGVGKEQIREPDILRAMDRQEDSYGTVLANHAVLARRPSIFRGFRAMWDGLDQSGLMGARMTCLLNVRVAGRIGCGL